MREVISWPIRVWLLFALLNLSIIISVSVVLSNAMILLFGACLIAATIAFSRTSRLILTVSDHDLSVGGARIESKFIREILALDEIAMKYERGAGLNPRAFLALRFWVRTGVKIILNDPQDPTPYWLVSTRRANDLKAKLTR